MYVFGVVRIEVLFVVVVEVGMDVVLIVVGFCVYLLLGVG